MQYGDNTNSLVSEIEKFNNSIVENTGEKYSEIQTVKASINQKIEDALGPRLGQSVNLQFSEASFNRIVENIRLVFFPQSKETDITKFRDLATNSLGYNNLQIVNLTVATACI